VPQPLVVGIVIIAALAVCLALAAAVSIKNVPKWARMVVFRRGRTGRDLVFGPGRHLVVPILDDPVMVDMREQTVKLPRQTVVTSDRSAVGVEFQVRFQVVDALLSETSVTDMRGAIGSLATAQLRAIVGRIHSADVQARKVLVGEELHVKLAEVVAGWGGRVVRVEIVNIGSPNRTALGDKPVAR